MPRICSRAGFPSTSRLPAWVTTTTVLDTYAHLLPTSDAEAAERVAADTVGRMTVRVGHERALKLLPPGPPFAQTISVLLVRSPHDRAWAELLRQQGDRRYDL